MKLKDVTYGYEGFYFCKKNKIYCAVITSHPDDGATLIVEKMEEQEDYTFDCSGEIYYSEACHLHTLSTLNKAI